MHSGASGGAQTDEDAETGSHVCKVSDSCHLYVLCVSRVASKGEDY